MWSTRKHIFNFMPIQGKIPKQASVWEQQYGQLVGTP